MLTLSPGLELGGWEPGGAHARRGRSLFFVNERPVGEMPSSPFPPCSIKEDGIWEVCHLHPFWFTSAWMAGPTTCPEAWAETASQAFWEMLRLG